MSKHFLYTKSSKFLENFPSPCYNTFVPSIFEYKKHKFFFFSNEGQPLEPCHIHIRKDEKLCKFWISDKATLAENYGFSPETLNELRKVADKNIKQIKEAWNEYFCK